MIRTAVGGALVLLVVTSSPANGSFVVIKDFDEWAAVAGSWSTADFVFDVAQPLTDQYADIGLIFPQGEEIAKPSTGFLLDGWGAVGSVFGDDDIHLKFLEPQYAAGVWFPGLLKADLYFNGALIFSSPDLETFPTLQSFGGIISDAPFDEVILRDPGGLIFVDNVLFGVPTPGAATVLALSGLAGSRRRSRR